MSSEIYLIKHKVLYCCSLGVKPRHNLESRTVHGDSAFRLPPPLPQPQQNVFAGPIKDSNERQGRRLSRDVRIGESQSGHTGAAARAEGGFTGHRSDWRLANRASLKSRTAYTAVFRVPYITDNVQL